MHFSSLAIVGLLMVSNPNSVVAVRHRNDNIDVVTSVMPTGQTRHVASGDMRCRLWERTMAYQDLAVHEHTWFCSFDEAETRELFGGYTDKQIVGLENLDIKAFLKLNNAVSGKTVLAIRGAEVFCETIGIQSQDIVALEEYVPRERGEPSLRGAVAGADVVPLDSRLRFPKPTILVDTPIDVEHSDVVIKESPKSGVGTTLFANSAQATLNESHSRPQDPLVRAEATGWNHHRKLAASTGTLNTLVVRVNAADNSPPPAVDLSNAIFFEEFCMKTQFDRCSYGALTIDEYDTGDRGITVSTTAPGVVDISISSLSEGMTREELQYDANLYTQALFGTSNLNSLFDLVMFCMPPGTGRWAAYAYVGRWDSYYNDSYCQSMLVQMHEVGHNIGLHHSGEYEGSAFNQEYGDFSGVMGAGDLAAAKCFNPAKNWQLGWYPNKEVEVDPATLTEQATSFILNGVVDYEDTAPDRVVVLKIANYYIGFNRATGFNSGTEEAANRVTVHEKLGDVESATRSKLAAKLDISQVYVIPINFLLEVEVRYVRNDEGKDAVIELRLNRERSECQGKYDAELQLELFTDFWPYETTWSIIDDLGLTEYGPRGGYDEEHTTFIDTVTGLCRGLEYYFVIEDTYGDGIGCGGGFTGRHNGQVIFTGGEFQFEQIIPFQLPILEPSGAPSDSFYPSSQPSNLPSRSFEPSISPSGSPSGSFLPSMAPSEAPSGSLMPSSRPSSPPSQSSEPSISPSYPSMVPSVVPTDTPVNDCVDDPTWLYRGRRNCDWIASRKNTRQICKRCAKNCKIDKTRIYTYCKATCDAAGVAQACSA